MKKRSRGLRRFGHASMAAVHNTVGEIRKLARDNAPITAGLLGAGAGAIMSSQSVGAASIIGAVTGIAIEEVTKK